MALVLVGALAFLVLSVRPPEAVSGGLVTGLIAGMACWLAAVIITGQFQRKHSRVECPNCHVSIPLAHQDRYHSYYPCLKCGANWTCDCGVERD